MLFLGANAAGRDDPDVVNLGNALARAGYAVMFHWSPTMALRANIEPAETGNLVWAFQYLSERDYVDLDRVGLGGFCVGASFALVAAADPRIREQVHFVNAFGPYYDARTLLLQAASRSVEYDGERTPWNPDRLTKRVLANELIETLESPEDADALTRRYMNGETLTEDELDALSPPALTIMRLLDGTTTEDAEALYETLPASFRQDLAGVSPSTYVDDIQARLLIMHDRNDRLVPAAESPASAGGDQGAGRRALHRGSGLRACAATGAAALATCWPRPGACTGTCTASSASPSDLPVPSRSPSGTVAFSPSLPL